MVRSPPRFTKFRRMNELEIAVRLQREMDHAGKGAWELSRQANVKLSMVEALLTGSSTTPIGALCRAGQALGLELSLVATKPVTRAVGPVKTVVDGALEMLEANRPVAARKDSGSTDDVKDLDIRQPMKSFIVAERDRLRRVNELLAAPEFDALSRHLMALAVIDSNGAWLVAWLMQPSMELGACPIDLVGEPGGLDLVADWLARNVLSARS